MCFYINIVYFLSLVFFLCNLLLVNFSLLVVMFMGNRFFGGFFVKLDIY